MDLGGLLVGREGRSRRLEDARQQELLVSEGLVGPAGTLPKTKVESWGFGFWGES